MTRVLGLVPYPTGRVPGQRFRIEQWAPRLRTEGVDVTFEPFFTPRAMDILYRSGHTATKARETALGYLRRLAVARRPGDYPGDYEVAYLYREAALLGPPWLERLIARRLPVVFDFDDAIYLPDASEANAWARAFKPRGKTEAICRLARHVTVGNETLAAFAAAHAQAVTVVPSTIDTDVYQVRPRPPNPRPVVGWTGSATTLRHLLPLAAALRRLRRSVDFELKVIGAEAQMDGLDVRCVPWRAETEAEDLRPLDVGLMPLPDDEWSSGKCGMKALQYMGLAIPPVVSPVGANVRIVQDGVSGFHARTEEEWADRIARLLHDPDLRARLGTAARRTVEESYSCRVHAPRVARIFREAAG